MGQSTYQMSRPDAALDLSCYNLSCDANVCVCRDGEFSSEKLGADKSVIINNGICPVDLDVTRHQLPVHCVSDVEEKCGCSPCGGGSDSGAGELTAEDVLAIATSPEAIQCTVDAITDAAAEK